MNVQVSGSDASRFWYVLSAEAARVTANVNGTVTPGAGADGIVKADAAAPARVAAVPEKTVVVPEVITTLSFDQKSVALPVATAVGVGDADADGAGVEYALGEAFADCEHTPPGVSVNVRAATVPVFLMVIGVVTVWPGIIMVDPPNLFIVAQVDEFVERPPPSVLRQVTVAPLFCSCMTSAPLAAVFVLLVMLATKPDNVPVIETDRSPTPITPVMIAIGAKRMRLFCLIDSGQSCEPSVHRWSETTRV